MNTETNIVAADLMRKVTIAISMNCE